MEVLVLTGDLVTQSKVAGSATAIGMAGRAAPNVERLLTLAQATEVFLVVLDLNTQGYLPGDVVGRLRSLTHPPKAILAFGPHVHEARLAAATEAGCDEVLSRGQFFTQTDEILRRYA